MSEIPYPVRPVIFSGPVASLIVTLFPGAETQIGTIAGYEGWDEDRIRAALQIYMRTGKHNALNYFRGIARNLTPAEIKAELDPAPAPARREIVVNGKTLVPDRATGKLVEKARPAENGCGRTIEDVRRERGYTAHAARVAPPLPAKAPAGTKRLFDTPEPKAAPKPPRKHDPETVRRLVDKYGVARVAAMVGKAPAEIEGVIHGCV